MHYLCAFQYFYNPRLNNGRHIEAKWLLSDVSSLGGDAEEYKARGLLSLEAGVNSLCNLENDGPPWGIQNESDRGLILKGVRFTQMREAESMKPVVCYPMKDT